MRKKVKSYSWWILGLVLSLLALISLGYHLFKIMYKPKNTDWWDSVKNFSPHEFDSPNEKGSGRKYMQPELIFKLDSARSTTNEIFWVNSGYRNIIYNALVRGVKNSEHTVGMAADIDYLGNASNFWPIYNALNAEGFVRMGLYYGDGKTFIHVGISKSLPQVGWAQWNGKKVTHREFLKRMEAIT